MMAGDEEDEGDEEEEEEEEEEAESFFTPEVCECTVAPLCMAPTALPHHHLTYIHT